MRGDVTPASYYRGSSQQQQRRYRGGSQGGIAPHPTSQRSMLEARRGCDWSIFNVAAQVVRQLAGRCIAMLRFAGRGFENDGFEIARHIRVDRARCWKLMIANTIGQRLGNIKCWLARREFIQSQAERVNVGAFIRAAFQLFGRHVLERAHDIAGLRQFTHIAQLGQSEIGDPHFAAAIQ